MLGMMLLAASACQKDDNDRDGEVEIPDFNFAKTVAFRQKLSAYQIFEGDPVEMTPTADFQLLELSSVLFTDYAHKQRLVKLPEGTQMRPLSDGSIDFPDGTMLTKTFYYYQNEGDTSMGRTMIETRLLIKESGIWNAASYLWNKKQTEATLQLNGFDTPISWIAANGSNQATIYHVPSENECMTCHQSNASMTPLGPTLLNLNRAVERSGETVNQLGHLQAEGILLDFDPNEAPKIVNYKNGNVSLDERGRAYLAMNCAHCHNPNAWELAANQELDFRYQTPLGETGILDKKDRIINRVSAGEMPLIGTTLIDQEGVDLINDYLNSL